MRVLWKVFGTLLFVFCLGCRTTVPQKLEQPSPPPKHFSVMILQGNVSPQTLRDFGHYLKTRYESEGVVFGAGPPAQPLWVEATFYRTKKGNFFVDHRIEIGITQEKFWDRTADYLAFQWHETDHVSMVIVR